MSISFISHKSSDGARLHAVLSLSVLRSLNHEQVEALRGINIHSLSDLLHFDPVHRARLIVSVARGQIAHDMDLKSLVRDADASDSPTDLASASTEVLDGIGASYAQLLRDSFGVETVAQLAEFPPFLEAESLLRNQQEAFSEPASAPDELIPKAIGAVVSKMRYSSFVKEKTVVLTKLNITANGSEKYLDQRLLNTLTNFTSLEIPLGYMVRHTQRWINVGTHLGEVIHSLALAPGESRNITVIDWKSNLMAQRREGTTIQEQLNSYLVHTRALDEVTRATAEEHQTGRTSTASATGVTAGAAVAAGSMVGAIGGAIVGGTTGLAIDIASAGTTLGAGTITGTILGSMAGTAVGSFAAGAASSLIFSGAGALGFIESDSDGDREIVGELHQNIMDVTSQKSSSVRSLRSTVVVEETQSGEGRLSTLNITNYNHSHALTIQYFEVLQHYHVQITADSIQPILFLPFKPLEFDEQLIFDYWEILKQGIQNQGLVESIEQLIAQEGTFVIPEQPVSTASEVFLESIKVIVNTRLPQTVVTEVFLIEGSQEKKIDEDLRQVDFSFSRVISTFEKNFPEDGIRPILTDISGIRIKMTGSKSDNFSTTVKVVEATFSREHVTFSISNDA